MARAVGLGSMFRGRIGSYVGFLTRNRAGRYVQSVKAYQPVVTNPKTFAQCLARIPLGPTQRFYSALSPIIERGFEGVAYGEPSKAEFLSYNLANFRGPYLTKQDIIPRPGPFLIANGSLAPIVAKNFSFDTDEAGFQTSINLGTRLSTQRISEITRAVLRSSSLYRVGDQLTFIWCLQLDGQVYYTWRSLYLDLNDQTIASFVLPTYEQLSVSYGDPDVYGQCIGGAVIRSQAFGDTSFKRSTAFFALNSDVYQFNDQAALMNAARSYMDTDSGDDEWPFDPTPEYDQVANICLVPVTADMTTSTHAPFIGDLNCLGYVTKGGVTGIFYVYSPTHGANMLIDGAADILTYSYDGLTFSVSLNADYSPVMLYEGRYGKLYV